MPTVRAKLSEKNKYYIPDHRYYELKHFCLQYPKWKEALSSLDGLAKQPDSEVIRREHNTPDPTAKIAMIRKFYTDRLGMIQKAAMTTDPLLYRYILLGVTEGRSFDNLKMIYNIPCDRNTYYNRYRRFFWELDKLRG